MKKELYFDINSEESGGSLYRLRNGDAITFIYQHSTYNDDTDEVKVFETLYASFEDFWQMIRKDAQWFYLHPLYIHPEQRAFIQQQLQEVNWSVQQNQKWQASHQRQWKKVLESKADYYQPGK